MGPHRSSGRDGRRFFRTPSPASSRENTFEGTRVGGFGFGTTHDIIPEMGDLAYLKHREGRGASNESLFTRGRGGRIGEAHVGRASCTVLRDSLE